MNIGDRIRAVGSSNDGKILIGQDFVVYDIDGDGFLDIGLIKKYHRSLFEVISETKKQDRYLDDEGKDLIDEWAEHYPLEIFRILMWEQMRKYHRRLGKKDDIKKEVAKIADYANRWLEVENRNN